MNTKKAILFILKFAVAIGFIYFLFSKIDWQNVKELVRNGDKQKMILSFFVFCFGFVVIQALKFHLLVRDITHSFLISLKISLIGFLFNNFLPTNIGGDGVKVVYLKRIKSSWGNSFALVFLERFTGLLSVLIICVVYLIFYFNEFYSQLETLEGIVKFDLNKAFIYTGGILVFLGVVVILLSRSKKLEMAVKLRNFIRNSMFTIQSVNRKKLFWVTVLSFMFHITRGFGFAVLLQFFHVSIAFQHLAILLFLTTFIGFLPISIGAMGTLEAAIIASLILFGINQDISISLAFVFRIFLFLVSIIGAVCFIKYKMIKYDDVK